MKRLTALSILVILAIAACKNDTSKTDVTVSTKEKVPVVPQKDISITDSNSYSDLFLDTAMV